MGLAGPVAVGVAGLAAAAGVGYLQGEKIGAARAVAKELFTREHAELREIREGVARVKETIGKIREAETTANHTNAGAAPEATMVGAAPSLTHEKGAAAPRVAPTGADRAAAPNIYLGPPGDSPPQGGPSPETPGGPAPLSPEAAP